MVFVVLGWPFGVKQAEPWFPVPLLAECETQWGFAPLDDVSCGTNAVGLGLTYWVVPSEQYGKLLKVGHAGYEAIEKVMRRYEAALGAQVGEKLAGVADRVDGDEGEQASTVSSSSL